MPLGQFLSYSPSVKAGLAYGMSIPSKPRTKKEKNGGEKNRGERGSSDKTTENNGVGGEKMTMTVSYEGAITEPMGNIMNFHTEGKVRVG